MQYYSTSTKKNIIGHKKNGRIAQWTSKRSRSRLIILISFALLSLIACSDDSDVVTQESTEKGNIIAEEHIGDSIISLFDNVLVNLEPENAQVGPNDTGGPGDDRWPLRIGRAQNLSLKIENLPNLTLSMQDAIGNQLATVFSDNSSKNVFVKPGTYQIVVHNEGAERVFFWTGWRDEGETTEPGICATNLNNAPPSAAIETPTGIPVFLTTSTEITSPASVSSYEEFAEKFEKDSDTNLDKAVKLFFINGGSTAYIAGVKGTSPGAYQAALDQVDERLGSEIQIVVTPDAADLDVSSWGAVVKTLVDSIGRSDGDCVQNLPKARAMLIIDPPQEARALEDVPDLRKNLPSTAYAAVYFPWLIGENGNPVSPSGAMAGIWSLISKTRGVWNAPANIEVAGVQKPEISINDEEQGDLNVPVDGKAFDALRVFEGRGTIVWGVRTLNGNSNDCRYIQVVRTLIYISQSLELTLKEFEYAPNDGNTWASIISIFSSFLDNLWAEGGLMGATPSEAYSVACGLGLTMTGQDILDGKLIVEADLQMIHPAEYIKLTFEQQMAGWPG